ncbi:hypothetical protein Pan44_49720 [Caulifigura coniformis]|uniref:Uncharacterized protein n=1 Tax=Caulifigura coniformis TaxID=2527983 RepID=A0A517SLB0_9PLAN|nr:hypothetical protein [Caulifigura coniformis]QDT56910.1 hypothetical protein Pan44_49720 [Caulifigura coniformis]
MIGDLCDLELVEDPELPPRTLVAPLLVVREIRSALGPVTFNLIVGEKQAVHISSDLFEAFGIWDAKESQASGQPEDDAPSADLN